MSTGRCRTSAHASPSPPTRARLWPASACCRRVLAPHGLATDRHGDIYVGEVSFTNMRNMGEGIPPGLQTLRKLVKVTD